LWPQFAAISTGTHAWLWPDLPGAAFGANCSEMNAFPVLAA
jgi:hypothetical protein